MTGYLIYGKRTGWFNIWDATYRALDSKGHRVTRLTDATIYPTITAAKEKLANHYTVKVIESGLVQFDIRPARR